MLKDDSNLTAIAEALIQITGKDPHWAESARGLMLALIMWEVRLSREVGRVYAVDANAYFSRSGPRLAEGVALLAGLLHPEHAVLARGAKPQHGRHVAICLDTPAARE